MQYFLNNNVEYVSGKKYSALYDFNNKQIFKLNGDGVKALMAGLHDSYIDVPEGATIEFLNNLTAQGLLTMSPTSKNIGIEKNDIKMIYAWLELTEKCNMNCIHCYGEFGHPSPSIKSSYLHVSDWKRIIDNLALAELKNIQFIGGEPLLYPHFKEILAYSHSKNMSVDMFTNGYFLNEEIISALKKYNATVRVSLYGHTPELHDAITHCPGSFERIDCALDSLKTNNVNAYIAVVIMSENEKYFDDIKNYVTNKGYLFSYDVIRPVSHGAQSQHCISNSELLVSRYHTCPDFSISEEHFKKSLEWNPCWFGKVAITSVGDVLPCTFSRELVCGNVLKDSQESIQNNLLHYWSLNKDKIEHCRECEYRYACHDCRPISLSITGSLHSKYPRCCYDPETGQWNSVESTALQNGELTTQ